MKNALVFYAGLLYGEYPFDEWSPFKGLWGLPDGAYILLPQPSAVIFGNARWYRSDFTPVLLMDVPKEYLVLSLLLT